MKEKDESLDSLITAINPIVTEIEGNLDSDRAVLMIAAKDIPGTGEMQSYVQDVGDLGLIQEALYLDLMNQLQNNNTDLFQALREVIHSIEEELDIDAETDLNEPKILH